MKSYPTFAQSVILLIIWFLCTILSVLVIIPFFGMDDGIGMMITYALSMALTVVAGLFLRGDWGMAAGSVAPLTVVAGALLILSLNILVEPLTTMVPMNDTLIKLFQGMKGQPIPFFFMAVVAAPILEEIMFRGIILDGFLKNYKPWQAILVSAFMFGAIHGNLAQGIGAFGIGIVLGWLYWKTNSIWPAILLHFVNNGVAFASTMYTDDADLTKSMRELMNNDFQYFGLYLISLLAFVLLALALYRKYRPQETTL